MEVRKMDIQLLYEDEQTQKFKVRGHIRNFSNT